MAWSDTRGERYLPKSWSPDVTQQYVSRKEILKYIQYYDMKLAKENMKQEKYVIIRERDCHFVQPYMFKKNLLQSRMEFLWDTLMRDTRTTMKGKGSMRRTNITALTVGRAGRTECWRLPDTY